MCQMLCLFVKKKKVKVLSFEICINVALLSPSVLVLGFFSVYWPHASNFHLCQTESSSEMLGWSSGPVGLWTSESTSGHWIEEKEGAILPSPAHSRAPVRLTIHSPPARYLRRAFKCSLKGKIAEMEEIKRLCSSRRSIAWHQPISAPMTSLYRLLLRSLGFHSIYFSFSLDLLSRMAFSRT